MRFTTIISLGVSIVLAIAAVFGVRSYLAGQRDLLNLQTSVPTPAQKNTIVVAAQPLRFGRLVEPTSLKVIDWPAGTVPEGAFKTIDEVIGDTGKQRYVMAAVEKDEPLLSSKITGPGQRATLSATLGPDMKAVSIRVNDVLGVAGFVLPGDRVDVMLTRERKDDNNENTSYIDVLLQGVRVLAVDQSADDRTDKPNVVKTITFEVSTTEAQKLALAANVGTLSLALRNIASSVVENVQQMNVADLDSGAAAKALAEEKARADALAKADALAAEALAKADALAADALAKADALAAEAQARADAMEKDSKARLEAQAAADAAKKAADDARFANIEKLVRQVGESVGKPIIIKEQVPAPVVAVAEPVAAPEPLKPIVSVVGVTRNGSRTEYQVRPIRAGITN